MKDSDEYTIYKLKDSEMKSLSMLAPICLSIVLFFAGCEKPGTNNEQGVSKTQVIAFGSCNKPGVDGLIWPAIAANEPEMFVWLGDIIYGDTHDMTELRNKYQEQVELPEYKKFAEGTSIIGVWDDHDYGINDGGKGYTKKEESKEVLMDFLQVGADSKMRQRAGAYSSTVLGKDDQPVKIILLDARSFRDTLVHSTNPDRRYEANPDGDVLGEAQWEWLEKELTNSAAKVHLIGSGIQFLAEEHGWEKWANFPKARQRLLDLIEKTDPQNTVLLSGDRHIAEVSRVVLDNLNKPLYDITASGLTHTWSRMMEEPNKHRVGELIAKRNFGLIKIDWDEANNPKLSVEVRGLENELFVKQDL